jgi:chaperonin GroES
MTTKMQTKLRPLGDRILVERKKVEEQITGGIILPDSAQSKQDIGTVIAVGPGKKDKDGKLIEISLKVGDIIMWDKYSGQEIKTEEDQEFIIVKSDDVIALVE